MEDVMSTIDDPNIVLETLTTSKQVKLPQRGQIQTISINQRRSFIDRMIELSVVGQRYVAVGRERRTNCLAMMEKLRRDWQSADQKKKKTTRNPGRINNFTGEHRAHVFKLVDDDPQVTVCDV
ncbi:hypothetical protein BD770DRAFT_431702 [Pilaira anomala]|nr:hypothetical protein BD770DRAFT_431702 [Pilaira anomala]